MQKQEIEGRIFPPVFPKNLAQMPLYRGKETGYNRVLLDPAARFFSGGIFMEKDVLISIKGLQRFEGAPPDMVELVTRGRLERTGQGYTLSYQESELTGLEGTLTTLQVEGEQVTLLRVGEFNSQMVFQEGRRHLSMYNTPYGAMAIGVNTRRLSADLTDRGGDIEIDYAIEVDHAVTGRNIFQINVKDELGDRR